ncbi:protein trichome birefringence-like 3 [Curcuma longa]|uniref:protein trichome birefringence-like 3 n=1 Tax=Curcuma longa TaxID=136217 RepID=UPI003D9DC20F
MKIPPKGKTPLSLTIIIIAVIVLMSVTFTEDLRVLTGTSTLKPPKASSSSSSSSSSSERDASSRETNEAVIDEEDKIEFNRKKCSVTEGKWVFNSSKEMLYTDESCPYLDKQLVCKRNGRPEDKYLYWEWELDDCTLPRFNVENVLRKLRGKRLMFVGDSMQRAQWQSFVCLIQAHIPPKRKLIKRNEGNCMFKAKDYNMTIEFYWTPFLVDSNTDKYIITDPNKRILQVDSIAHHARSWVGVDIFVFSSYTWWMSGQSIKSSWGSFANGEKGYEELDVRIAYKLGLKTWANWVDSSINPNTTRVFFATMSPSHLRSSDWGNEDGIQCFKETMPVAQRGFSGSGTDKQMMEVVTDVIERMKVPVTVLNITQLTDYRIDAHVSVYTQLDGKVLSDEQKKNPLRYADCIHWCLPGVPDIWNQLLYAYL